MLWHGVVKQCAFVGLAFLLCSLLFCFFSSFFLLSSSFVFSFFGGVLLCPFFLCSLAFFVCGFFCVFVLLSVLFFDVEIFFPVFPVCIYI